MAGNILVIDDDRSLARVLKEGLALDGFAAACAHTGEDGKSALKKGSFDLVILDFNLPDMTGIELLRSLKQDASLSHIPVLMLTVKGDEVHKVKGFEVGVDDYVVKPVSIPELVGRVKAILRRTQRSGSALEAEGIKIDLEQKEAWLKGKRLDLTPTEWAILAALMSRKGVVLTYAALAESIPAAKDSQKLYSHVTNLRKKLGAQGRLIESVYGAGYKFAP